MPLIYWGGAALIGLFGLGYASDKVGEAATETTSLVKWVVIGGVVYMVVKSGAYKRVLK
ncbi:MAG: hypothetical protein GXP05_13430 [Alphaproteobacteria bacterium]|nr:hypothetical protein [Alphaproteobacteria bacterium]